MYSVVSSYLYGDLDLYRSDNGDDDDIIIIDLMMTTMMMMMILSHSFDCNVDLYTNLALDFSSL